MCGKYGLTKFANFLIIVLRVEIATIFKAESLGYINFGILLLFKGSFRECSFIGQDLSRTKISL